MSKYCKINEEFRIKARWIEVLSENEYILQKRCEIFGINYFYDVHVRHSKIYTYEYSVKRFNKKEVQEKGFLKAVECELLRDYNSKLKKQQDNKNSKSDPFFGECENKN